MDEMNIFQMLQCGLAINGCLILVLSVFLGVVFPSVK